MYNISVRKSSFKSDFLFVLIGSALSILVVQTVNKYEGWEAVIPGALVAFVSAVIMHKTNEIFNLRRLTIPAVWWYAYFLLIFIPSLYIFRGQPSPYRYTYIFAVGSALITVPLGILLTNITLKFHTREIRRYYDAPVQDKMGGSNRISYYGLALLLAAGLTISWYLEQSAPIPLVYMFMHPGEAGELAWLRDYSFKLLDSPIRYFYHLTRDFLYPLLVLVALGNYRYTRRRGWLYLLLISMTLGFLYASANVARSPSVTLMLLILLYLYVFNGGRVSVKTALVGAPMLFVFPVIVQVVSQGDWSYDGVAEAFQTILERIFIAPSSVLYYFFEVVPEKVPFLYGRGMGSITRLVGVEYYDLGHYVGTYVLGPGGNGYSSATGAFVAELYTDFSLIGVLLGGLLVGVVMQWLHIGLLRRRKTVFAVATYTLTMYFFFSLVYLQIVGALLLSGLPILWVLFRKKWLG